MNFGQFPLDGAFQLGGPVVRRAQRQRRLHLQVEVHADPAIDRERRHVVDLEVVPVRNRANPVHQVSGSRRPGSRIDDHVGGWIEGVDRRLDVIDHGLGMFQGDVALQGEPEVHKQPVAASTDSDPILVQDPGHTGDGAGEPFGHPFGRGIEQRIDRLVPQAQSHVQRDPGDDQRGHGVGVAQPGGQAQLRGREQDEAEHDRARAVGIR